MNAATATNPETNPADRVSPFALSGGVVAFDGHRVLDTVDVTIGAGEYVVLLGANGSGKTTLLRTLLGLTPLTAGDLLVYGRAPSAFRDWQRIAYVPQRLIAATSVPVSVEEAVRAALASPRHRWNPRRHRNTQTAVHEALDTVGLLSHRRDRLDTLSGGQQRRVMAARALASNADTVLLDEPTAGVDADSEKALAHTLADLHAAGRTIVLVTHHLGLITAPSDHVVMLGGRSGGQVLYDGAPPPPRELLESDWHHHDDRADHPQPPGWVTT